MSGTFPDPSKVSDDETTGSVIDPDSFSDMHFHGQPCEKKNNIQSCVRTLWNMSFTVCKNIRHEKAYLVVLLPPFLIVIYQYFQNVRIR